MKKALAANGYKKWSFEIPQKKEEIVDPSHDHTKGERVYPVCIPYVVGYQSTSNMCSGHMVWYLTTSHLTPSDPSW